MTRKVFTYKYFLKLPLPLPSGDVLHDRFKRRRKAIPGANCTLQPRKKYAYNDNVLIKSYFPTVSNTFSYFPMGKVSVVLEITKEA